MCLFNFDWRVVLLVNRKQPQDDESSASPGLVERCFNFDGVFVSVFVNMGWWGTEDLYPSRRITKKDAKKKTGGKKAAATTSTSRARVRRGTKRTAYAERDEESSNEELKSNSDGECQDEEDSDRPRRRSGRLRKK